MKKVLLILIILFCVIFYSTKVQGQNRHRRHNLRTNVLVTNKVYYLPIIVPIYITNQYSAYHDTVYYLDCYGYKSEHGFNIYRHYTVFSNGFRSYVETYIYF